MNLSRENAKLNHFIDLHDGPSTLQKRVGVPTMQEKSRTPILFESERKEHADQTENHVKAVSNIRNVLFSQEANATPKLQTPREARAEMKKVKDNMNLMNEYNV